MPTTMTRRSESRRVLAASSAVERERITVKTNSKVAIEARGKEPGLMCCIIFTARHISSNEIKRRFVLHKRNERRWAPRETSRFLSPPPRHLIPHTSCDAALSGAQNESTVCASKGSRIRGMLTLLTRLFLLWWSLDELTKEINAFGRRWRTEIFSAADLCHFSQRAFYWCEVWS